MIDVREQSELEIARFSKEFLHIPISKVTCEYVKEIFAGLLDKEIVVTCHAGIRSYNFSQWCLDNSIVSEIWNLEEGIDGWSRYIDPSIPSINTLLQIPYFAHNIIIQAPLRKVITSYSCMTGNYDFSI